MRCNWRRSRPRTNTACAPSSADVPPGLIILIITLYRFSDWLILSAYLVVTQLMSPTPWHSTSISCLRDRGIVFILGLPEPVFWYMLHGGRVYKEVLVGLGTSLLQSSLPPVSSSYSLFLSSSQWSSNSLSLLSHSLPLRRRPRPRLSSAPTAKTLLATKQ